MSRMRPNCAVCLRIVPVSTRTFRIGMWRIPATSIACSLVVADSIRTFRDGMWRMRPIWSACFADVTRSIADSWRPGLCQTSKVSPHVSPSSCVCVCVADKDDNGIDFAVFVCDVDEALDDMVIEKLRSLNAHIFYGLPSNCCCAQQHDVCAWRDFILI
jgi:hypothetical protein